MAIKRFEKTSSTKLELQTFLWAFDEVRAMANDRDIIVTAYTDSQNVIGLAARRTRLEQNNFFSSKNKRLNNYELYQEFYRVTEALNCELIKVVGHKPSGQKNNIDTLFAIVDQASRIALRNEFTAQDTI